MNKNFLIGVLLGFLSVASIACLRSILPHNIAMNLSFYLGFSLAITIPLALTGVFVSPLLLYRFIKKRPSGMFFFVCLGVLLGLLLAIIVSILVNQWEDNRRNKVGQYIVTQIKSYKIQHGHYPKRLDELGGNWRDELPYPFAYTPFNYAQKSGQLILTTRWWFDTWAWNDKTQKFDFYSD